jgi:hypothetical protein
MKCIVFLQKKNDRPCIYDDEPNKRVGAFSFCFCHSYIIGVKRDDYIAIEENREDNCTVRNGGARLGRL